MINTEAVNGRFTPEYEIVHVSLNKRNIDNFRQLHWIQHRSPKTTCYSCGLEGLAQERQL